MSDAKLVNIARVITTYNFEIEQLPAILKCTQWKLVLNDACQLPCGCTYCRACIDDMMANGEFCPGDSEDCAESILSRFTVDFKVNKSVSRLSIKSPHDVCVYKCRLANIEEHLRECQRKTEECPFRELGCTQDKLAAVEMGGHLQHENSRHSKILIGMIANINREIETLKRRDEASEREIETLKHELEQKDGEIRSIMDQMIHVQNENKSIKNEVKSIKAKSFLLSRKINTICIAQDENEDLADRVRILTEEIEREIIKRRENDELNMARLIEHVDREIATVTQLIVSNKIHLVTELQSVRSDIKSINEGMLAGTPQPESIQDLEELGQVDANFEWLIDDDVGKTSWWTTRETEYFTGEVHLYKYRLASWNSETGTDRAALCIRLYIYKGLHDEQLVWPFKGRVVITVTDRSRRKAFKSISRQCRIERPPYTDCRWSDPFKFLHSELKGAGLSLSHGACVSCVIVPGAFQ